MEKTAEEIYEELTSPTFDINDYLKPIERRAFLLISKGAKATEFEFYFKDEPGQQYYNMRFGGVPGEGVKCYRGYATIAKVALLEASKGDYALVTWRIIETGRRIRVLVPNCSCIFAKVLEGNQRSMLMEGKYRGKLKRDQYEEFIEVISQRGEDETKIKRKMRIRYDKRNTIEFDKYKMNVIVLPDGENKWNVVIYTKGWR